MHVGALLGNTPAMLTALAAAGLGGYVLCGVNDTRRGSALAGDLRTADVQLLLVDAEHRALLQGLELPGVTVIDFGTNVVDGRLQGDVAFGGASAVAGAITPVPGGTGPVTTAVLGRNLLRAARAQHRAAEVRSS